VRSLLLVLALSRSRVDPRGTLVIVGGGTGGRWLAGNDRQPRALLLSPFTGQILTTLICSENTPDLLALTNLIESGQVRPVIDQTYLLRQTPAAIQYKRDGHAQARSASTSEPRWGAWQRSGVTAAPFRFPRGHAQPSSKLIRHSAS
jgi:hypothetical protein